MRKYYFTIASILFLVVGLTSCSIEETKKQNDTTSRPSVPDIASDAREVQIGTQIWMTKNLNVSRYRNGDPIPQVTNPTEWANLTTGAWCYYNNASANGRFYGKLYNWYAVNDPRGLAPVGYHVPTDDEWTNLTTFLGGPSVGGGKMKSIGTSLWLSPNTNATNSSGFTGLPGGFRRDSGLFLFIGNSGHWWSQSDFIAPTAWCRFLYYDNDNVDGINQNKTFGISVRCIKD